MNRNLYMAALRIVAQYAQGHVFSPEDLSTLRRHALPREADLPLDLLCCRIITRELEPKPSRRSTASKSRQ